MHPKAQMWLDESSLDPALKKELYQLDAAAIEDAFYKDVSFGTGGIRGVLGVGTNRLNVHTVRKAIQGFALYLLKHVPEVKTQGIVIAYDNRHQSVAFAQTCVGVLAHHGIPSHLFDALRPTPVLSFAVRHVKAAGGIMITASHNPPKYNGIKLYDSLGCQLVPAQAQKVIDEVNTVHDLFKVPFMTFEEARDTGWVTSLSRPLDQTYLEACAPLQALHPSKKNTKVIFTPLHGTSREIGLRVLNEAGFEVIAVESQMVVDPNFSTVASPNPENPSAFTLAEELGHVHQADVLIATDPDADRLGLAVRHHGSYVYLTGNQTGALMLDFVIGQRQALGTLPKNGQVFTTIVTSDLGAMIAQRHGLTVTRTLTGFKFIGEKMADLEADEFVMGYEESYGYVLLDIVRDKDAIQAMLVGAQMVDHYKAQGLTLVDRLETLYETYGYVSDHLINFELEGQSGEAKIHAVMDHFRTWWPEAYLGQSALRKEDYQDSTVYEPHGPVKSLEYPQENVLKFIFKDFWFVLRPSGTEPKLKIYLQHQGHSTKEETYVALEMLKRQLTREIHDVIEKRNDA